MQRGVEMIAPASKQSRSRRLCYLGSWITFSLIGLGGLILTDILLKRHTPYGLCINCRSHGETDLMVSFRRLFNLYQHKGNIMLILITFQNDIYNKRIHPNFFIRTIWYAKNHCVLTIWVTSHINRDIPCCVYFILM